MPCLTSYPLSHHSHSRVYLWLVTISHANVHVTIRDSYHCAVPLATCFPEKSLDERLHLAWRPRHQSSVQSFHIQYWCQAASQGKVCQRTVRFKCFLLYLSSKLLDNGVIDRDSQNVQPYLRSRHCWYTAEEHVLFPMTDRAHDRRSSDFASPCIYLRVSASQITVLLTLSKHFYSLEDF